MNPRSQISKPPDFPRPSSATRSQLKNRLVRKSNGPPAANTTDRNDENTSRLRDEIKSIMKNRTNPVVRHDWDSDACANAVVGSSAWPDDHDLSVMGDEALSEESITHMKSTIIKSHSLDIPGMESVVLHKSGTSVSSSQMELPLDRSDISLTSSNFMNIISNHQGLDQAIHLIMSGQQEFCYLEPLDPSNPYRLALTTTPKDKRNNRYITLSTSGIVRYGWGEPDRITLREFVREYYLYHMAVKIPFFVKFWKW